MIFKNIQALCRKNGISISKLEKECGLANATVRGWEHSSPKVETVKKVADYFGCTVDDLLRGDDE